MQYTFVEASLSQKREDFIIGMRHCPEYFGGAPQAIVSDNLKSAVSKSCKYGPVINKTFKDFALHYGCVIDPARPCKPQDKALVEGAVRLVYQRIFYPFSNMTFFSLKELNEAIRKQLIIYSGMPAIAGRNRLFLLKTVTCSLCRNPLMKSKITDGPRFRRWDISFFQMTNIIIVSLTDILGNRWRFDMIRTVSEYFIIMSGYVLINVIIDLVSTPP